MRTNADLTLYNHFVDPATRDVIYQRTHLTGVYWENRRAANKLASGGSIAADKVLVMIPFVGHHDAFLDPVSWAALVDKSAAWTLAVDDYIVRGLVSDEITGEFSISDLKQKHDDVLKIASVDTFDMGSLAVQHWEVSAT